MPGAFTQTPSLADEPWGDSAVLFTATGDNPQARWRAALDLHRLLGRLVPPGVEDWIHAYESVLVSFDCGVTDGPSVVAAVRTLLAVGTDGEEAREPSHFELPVVFGGDWGPDLPEVAAEAGMSESRLVDQVVSGDLVIGCVGGNFGPLMERRGQRFSVHRMTSPRTLVPAGSLALAGTKTTIYPVDSPGGWRIIGRTPVALYDIARNPMIRYAAGDLIRVRAMDPGEWEHYAGVVLGAAPEEIR